MQKKIIYFVIAFSCIAVSIVITEGIYFYIVLNRHPSTNKVDVIVVFPGSADRIETGFQLLQHRQAKSIFIPGIDESAYKRFAKRHK
ncbi:MAG: hypothetical protein KAU38_12225 [Desulfobacterales bacterium]|nr:hypothetical protein [Desulfobacterales bacterium]